MRPLYDEFEDLDFGDMDVVNKMMREQEREDQRLASRRRSRPARHRWQSSLDDDEELSGVTSYEEIDVFDDYDEDEFDSYAEPGTRR